MNLLSGHSLKRSLLMVGALFLLLVILLVITIFNLNYLVNRNKEALQAQVEQKLGRKIKVSSMEASVWGGLGLRLHQPAVADDPTFSTQDFIRAEELQINVKWWPLLRKKLEISRMILHKPMATVIRDEKGRYNFSTLSPKESEPKKAPAQGAGGAAFLLSHIDCDNGEFLFQDKKQKQDFRVRQIRLTLDHLGPDQKMSLAFEAAILGEKKNLVFQGRLGPLGATPDFSNAPIEGALEIDTLPLEPLVSMFPALKDAIPPGLGLSGPVNVKTTLSGKGSELTFTRAQVRASVFGEKKPNFQFTGTVGPVGATAKNPAINGEMTLDPVSAANLLRFPLLAGALPKDWTGDGPVSLKAKLEGTWANLAIQGNLTATPASLKFGELFNKPAGAPLQIALEGRKTDTALEWKNSSLKLLALDLTSSGNVTFAKNPSVNLSLKSGRADLAGWEKIIPAAQGYELAGRAETDLQLKGEFGGGKIPSMNGSLALDSVKVKLPQIASPVTELNGKIALTGEQANLKDLSFRVGQTSLRGEAQVSKWSPLAVAYALILPELRLSDFQKNTSSENKDRLLEVKSEGRISREKDSWSGKGNLVSPKGVLANTEYTQFKADYSLAANQVKLDNLSLQAYGGTLQGAGVYDFGGSTPKFTLTAKNQSLDLVGLWGTVLASAPKNVKGKLNSELSLSGSGKTWPQIKPSLQGQGALEVIDGAMLDVNIAQSVLGGLAGNPILTSLLTPDLQQKFPQLFQTQNTTFTRMKGTLSVCEGKILFKNLIIEAADWSANAEGELDLDLNLNSVARLSLSPALSTALVKSVPAVQFLNNEQKRIEIPFALTGVLPSVKPKPDMAFVGRMIQQSLVGKGLDLLQKKMGTKLPLPGR